MVEIDDAAEAERYRRFDRDTRRFVAFATLPNLTVDVTV